MVRNELIEILEYNGINTNKNKLGCHPHFKINDIVYIIYPNEIIYEDGYFSIPFDNPNLLKHIEIELGCELKPIPTKRAYYHVYDVEMDCLKKIYLDELSKLLTFLPLYQAIYFQLQNMQIHEIIKSDAIIMSSAEKCNNMPLNFEIYVKEDKGTSVKIKSYYCKYYEN